MLRLLLSIALAGCAYASIGDRLCPVPANPVVNTEKGYTLDEIIDQVINDTDVNKNGLIDLDEAHAEFLDKWSGGGDSVSKDVFVRLFDERYHEDAAVTAQFFDNMDVNNDGVLTEMDFILQVFDMGIIPFVDDVVDLVEFRAFIHKRHPNGCV